MRKLRIGMIGTGGIADGHGSQLAELEEVEICSVADPSTDQRQRFVNKFKLHEASQFSDYQELLWWSRPDAVVICTPHTQHFRQASDALRAGCHVLIEKPMTCTSIEAIQLIETAMGQGRRLQVAYQRHFQPEFMYIKQAIEEGQIGRLVSVSASLCQNWKQLTRGQWRQDPALSGGGFLMDSGSHVLDVLLWTTGLTPQEVSTRILQQETPVEIDSFTSIRFAEGAVAGLTLLGSAPCWEESYIFCGEEGGLFYRNGQVTLSRPGGEMIIPLLPEGTYNQDRSFIESILRHEEVQVPGSVGFRVVELTEMIYRAGGYQPLA